MATDKNANGWRVRGTVRSTKNEEKIRPIKALHPAAKDRLELVEADLTKPDSWPNAVKGCSYVLHVASPFPIDTPRDEDEVVKPALEGTVNVLKACAADGNVKRVVLTSSSVAIFQGYSAEEASQKVFNENDWTKLEGPDVGPYEKSKVVAEKAAWDLMKYHPKFELVVLCPGFVIGPMLHNTECSSALILKRVLTRHNPMVPQLCFPCVDVRDVARGHIKAITNPKAAGERIMLVSEVLWFKQIAQALYDKFFSQGYNVPTREAPYFLLYLMSFFDRTIKGIVPRLGMDLKVDNSKMKQILGLDNVIKATKATVDMGYSLIEKGIVPKTSKYRGPSTTKS